MLFLSSFILKKLQTFRTKAKQQLTFYCSSLERHLNTLKITLGRLCHDVQLQLTLFCCIMMYKRYATKFSPEKSALISLSCLCQKILFSCHSCTSFLFLSFNLCLAKLRWQPFHYSPTG